jgi:hypothetical protein
MLYVDDKLTLKPDENLLRWTEEVLSESEKGLIWSLALMNQLVQGHSTEQSLSIVKIFKRNAKPIKESSVCSQIHKYRLELYSIIQLLNCEIILSYVCSKRWQLKQHFFLFRSFRNLTFK